MQAKIENVIIGKDISRTGSAVIGGAGETLAVGEVFVLDKDRNIMTAGATYTNTDTIYLVEVLTDTYDYSNEAGTAVTGVHKLLYSNPIKGNYVTEYSGKAYAAAAEEVLTIDLTGWTPVIGTDYSIRVVYTDINEHPGGFTKTYHYTAASAVLDTEGDAFATKINTDPDRRIVAAYNAGPNTLTLTGLAYDDNDEVDEINDYAQVTFKAFLLSNNYNTLTADPYSSISTVPTPGNGTYRLVRDEEKWAQGYEGALNRTIFPVQKPVFRTVKDETYDTIVIRQKDGFVAAGGRSGETDITTKLFIPYTATTNQMDTILSVLNPWMASLPTPFANVSF